MKRSQPKRDWSDARAKVEEDGVCRLALRGRGRDCAGPLEAAHVIGRERDFYTWIDPDDLMYPEPYKGTFGTLKVHPTRIVPLCSEHHRLFDAGELDLLPYLELDEALQAVQDAGGIEQARVRLAPSCYRKAAA